MFEKRLGDIIDDHCVKCRRVTNHAIVSLVNGEAAKVRCRTCYHDHDYRHEQAPPTKKELKKMEADALAAAEKQASGAESSDDIEQIDEGVEQASAEAEDVEPAEMEPLETAPPTAPPAKSRRLKAVKA